MGSNCTTEPSRDQQLQDRCRNMGIGSQTTTRSFRLPTLVPLRTVQPNSNWASSARRLSGLRHSRRPDDSRPSTGSTR
jgi:hypothetical protein